VPLEDFRTTTALHTQRWPQIVANVAKKRERYRRQQPRLARKREA
jgi:hypothetical protein